MPYDSGSEDEEDLALPSKWRTVSHVGAQVRRPGFILVDSCSAVVAAPVALVSPSGGMTVVLHHFFGTEGSAKRRREDVELHHLCNGELYGKRWRHASYHRCCSRGLHSIVSRAIRAARCSIGSCEDADDDGATARVVVVVHLSSSSQKHTADDRPAEQTRSVRGPTWFVDGICLAEELSQAYRAAVTASPRQSLESPVSASHASTGVDGGVTASSPVSQSAAPSPLQATHLGELCDVRPPFCGVRLLWVSPAARGRGMAYRMVEDARRAVCYGLDIPPEQVAFSEPTLLGSRFARRYQQRDDFLVYP